MESILWALWFFLPAGVGNMSPIIAAKTPWVNKYKQPMDFGQVFRGHRITGDHKTWRGIIVGTLAGGVVGLLQMLAYGGNEFSFIPVGLVDYSSSEAAYLGLLLGFGALFGDALKSFFKRQVGVSSGKSWIPFDQLDYIIGGCLFAGFIVILPLMDYLMILVVWLSMHVLFSFVGFKLGLKKTAI